MKTELFSLRTLLMVSLATLLFSCENGIEGVTAFKVKSDATFTISSGTGINTPLSVPTPDVTTNASREFENNNTNASLVKEATLETLKLTIQSPSGQTFQFVKSVIVYVSAEGLPEAEIARRTDIDNSVGNSIDLVTSKTNLKEYIKRDRINIRTEVVTDEVLLHDVRVKADMTYKVKAKLL